jgi:4-diphosphocytidyl-2-C-methyl-D-erythritol kinase
VGRLETCSGLAPHMKNMTRRLRVRSLAKINLDLRVLHKRPDGYHELRTVFQTISLADTIEIEFEKARRTEFSIDDPLAIPDNLILRAAARTLDALKTHARVRFRLTKRIPMGGGCGGGSSNAAAILLALGLGKLSLEKLAEIGAGLGSDVPFFLMGGTALGIGRGTEVYPLPELRPYPILLVAPDIHVSTGQAYGSLTVTDSSSKLNTFLAFTRMLGGVCSAAAVTGSNDFESAVFQQYPQIQAIRKKLVMLGAAGARMTGSGSAVFAVFESREQRDHARVALEQDRRWTGCRIIPASLVNRRAFQRMWRRQLGDQVGPEGRVWPPPSRYAR